MGLVIVDIVKRFIDCRLNRVLFEVILGKLDVNVKIVFFVGNNFGVFSYFRRESY